MLCNVPEQWRSHLQCGKSLKSWNQFYLQEFNMKSTGYPAAASPTYNSSHIWWRIGLSLPSLLPMRCDAAAHGGLVLSTGGTWIQRLKSKVVQSGEWWWGAWNYSKVQLICQETMFGNMVLAKSQSHHCDPVDTAPGNVPSLQRQ
jgi:hypothetical protein